MSEVISDERKLNIALFFVQDIHCVSSVNLNLT